MSNTLDKKKNCSNCLFSHFKEIENNLIGGYKLGREIKRNLKKVVKDKKLPFRVKEEAEILLIMNRRFIKKKLN